MTRFHLALLAISTFVGLSAAEAATFQIDFGPAQTTFVADPAGGPVSGFSITLGGVTFDDPTSGINEPTYHPAQIVDDPVFGPTSYDASIHSQIFDVGFGIFLNSAAAGSCQASGCFLALSLGNGWSAFQINPNLVELGHGSYAISGPIAPVPASSAALFLVSSLLVLVGFRRQS